MAAHQSDPESVQRPSPSAGMVAALTLSESLGRWIIVNIDQLRVTYELPRFVTTLRLIWRSSCVALADPLEDRRDALTSADAERH
jgi:hypothetical protein